MQPRRRRDGGGWGSATGLIEIGLGLGLALAPSRRRLLGRVTALYLVAVFPANVYVAVSGPDVEGQPGGAYPWLQLPFQALFIAWTLWSTARPSGTVPSRPIAAARAPRPAAVP